MKVLLFTDRKSTSPLMKSLSKKYKGKLVFGEVRNNAESELIKKFGIKKFPTLIAVTDPVSYEYDVYDGEMNPDRISLFLGKYAYSKQKKEKKAEWLDLNKKSFSQKGVCSKKNAQNCFIVCQKEAADKTLKKLPEFFLNEKISFVYYSENQDYCASQFGGNKAVFLKSKFGKIYAFKGRSTEEARGFIENILGGGGESQFLEGKALRFPSDEL